MNSKKTTHVFIAALLSINIMQLNAQDSLKKQKQDFPIALSVTSHSWAFPLTDLFRLNPYYPGLNVNTEYYYRKRAKHKLFQTAEIGGFLNNSSGSAFYLNSNFGYRFTAKFGLMLDVSLGLGYFHGFHPRTIYTQDSDGTFSKVKDKGIPSLSANFATGLGYDLSKVSNIKMTPFIRYQWIASTSYWSMIGIRPNGLLHLGIQISI